MLVRMTEWLTDNFRSNAGFPILFQKVYPTKNISAELLEALYAKCPSREIIGQMIKQILAVGEEEGVIQKKHSYYGTVAVVSQIMAYSIYLSDNKLDEEVSEQDARDFVVENIIKMLN